MTGRLPTSVLVTALVRRVNYAGGLAVVRAKGDPQAGAVLLVLEDRNGPPRLIERGIGADGGIALIDSTPPGDVDEYWRRRCTRDPDLWVVALDIADAERFAAETMLVD